MPRLHNTAPCFQSGYVLSGNFVASSNSPCPNGNPPGKTWFNVLVEVSSDGRVEIFLNGDLVNSQTSHFNTKGRGGVVVANGYQNVMKFRDFSLYGMP